MAQSVCFHTGARPVFLRITCVTPGAGSPFVSSVTSAVKKQKMPVKPHPAATRGYVSSSHIQQSH